MESGKRKGNQKMKKKKKGTVAWVMEFAGMNRKSYLGSVIMAILSVTAGFLPYLFIANMVRALINGNRDMHYYLVQCAYMALCWLINRIFHAISTTMSHRATFGVLAEIRRRLTKKLSRMPLGDVLDDASGSYKNIIVERVDSIETTLAHIIPEVISKLNPVDPTVRDITHRFQHIRL
jgi:ATP-binding cassette subfamily B protein